MAGLRCATCGRPIEDVDTGLLRATDKGKGPIRRGSFKFVHKGACDVPKETTTAYSKDWDLKSLVMIQAGRVG